MTTFNTESIKQQKAILRKSFRLLRSKLSEKEQIEKANQLVQQVIHCPEFISSQHIAAYWPNDNEISPIPLLEHISILGKKCYLPIIQNSAIAPVINFAEYKPGDTLVANRLGILEPLYEEQKKEKNKGSTTKSELYHARQLDLVLIPLVAFDERGHRLGMGKGYYDRTFSFLKKTKNQASTHPFLIGLAYECQKADTLPIDTWDISLSGIATEKRYIPIEVSL